MRRLLALLLTAWTAALPANVPVIVCFCSHDAEKPCRHGSGEHARKHEHPHPSPAGGIGDTAPAPEMCRCYVLRSSQDLVRVGASDDLSAREAVAEPPAAPVEVEASARLAPPEVPRALGPPIFLRLLVLLV